MYNEFTKDERIKIYKTLNGKIVNNTEKNYTNGRHFEYIPYRRLGEGVYRLGMGARKTKKKVAKSLSNSMKKAKKMFRSMTRKRGENYNNISQKTLKGLGLDKNGSEGNSGPYQAGPLTTNKMTGHSVFKKSFYDENRTRRRSLN
jgi:hypothetical protein